MGIGKFSRRSYKISQNKGHEVVLVAPEKEDKQMRTTIPDGVHYIQSKWSAHL